MRASKNSTAFGVQNPDSNIQIQHKKKNKRIQSATGMGRSDGMRRGECISARGSDRYGNKTSITMAKTQH